MEEKQENIVLRLPVKINYKVLEGFLRNELVGEVVRDDNSDGDTTEYAEIQALSLRKSPKENFDLALILRLKTLTSFFKNKIVRMSFHAALEFRTEDQEVFVKDYTLEGENRGWIMNKFIQVLANTFMYSSLKKKMKFNFQPLIEKKLAEVNQKLAKEAEVFDGISLTGKIQQFRISDIIPGEDHLLVMVAASGNTVVNVRDINFQVDLEQEA
ncbi:DUF4403 family protein [Salinimicrobium gaetbulicola]|uniref:DUF4403 family protein n=1 Tax=Salinimicrobium gaetbulicola TaxID=999702 RepID=A0ABW3IEY3_9FLAO